MPLVEERRFGGVEIFRIGLPQRSAAKGDHPAAPVRNGEHQPVTEAVICLPPVVRLDNQPALDQRRLRHPAGDQRLFQGRAAVRRITKAERRHRPFRQLPPREIAPRAAARLTGKLADEPLCGQLHRVMQRRGSLLPLPLLRPLHGHGNPGEGGEALDGLRKLDAFRLLHKFDQVAIGAATEAVIEALFLIDGEGRRFFIMKRAEAGIFPPLFHQLRAPPDHIDKTDARLELFHELRRKGHAVLFRI